MSINLFADRKMAMGFAGVIAGLAMIAGLSMGAFTPRGDDEAANAQPAERIAVVDRTAPAPARQPTATWENDGSLDESEADDWAGDNAAPSGAFDGDSASASGNDDQVEPGFGTYAPVSSPRSSVPPRQASAREPGGPLIRSRASPNAPAIKPPGNS